jgi:aerobic C4-dicarboxylate transport protein
VIGISSLGDMARAGGLALRALGYFLGMTVVALGLGLLAGNLVKPGSGFEGEVSASPRRTRRRRSARPATTRASSRHHRRPAAVELRLPVRGE